MASYQVELKRSAAKEVASISDMQTRVGIVARIGNLADDPRPAGCLKLSGQSAWRIRHGANRILYTIDEIRRVVTIVRVRHRRDAYR